MSHELVLLGAVVRCDHDGHVETKESQDWVTVEGTPVLRADDPERRDIGWCPSRGANIKPCGTTLNVEEGYSELLYIDGQHAVLASLRGKTDGTPPGAVHYRVRDPAQRFVVVEI